MIRPMEQELNKAGMVGEAIFGAGVGGLGGYALSRLMK